jgi:hypothetical protein
MGVEAARTTASSAEIWTICVVAVGCLAFWLIAIAAADRSPYWRHWQRTDVPGSVLGGIHMAEGGRSVAPNRDAPALVIGPGLELPAQRGGEPAAAGQATPAAASGAAGAAGQAVPAPRAGTADAPEPSVTGSGAAQRDGGAR